MANFELSPNIRDLTKISTDEISADLSHLSEKHPEMFEKASDVFKLIKEIKDEPQFFYRNNRLDGALIAKRLQEQGKIGKVVVNKENGEVIHATKAREQDLARLERVANKNDERVRALSAVSSRKVEQGGGLPNKTIPQHHLKTADDIIDLVPDENGVYGVAYNGSSKELAKIATEIAKGDIQSLGAKRLVFIADNIAAAAAKDAEQKISANIAKIDDDSVELYANNTALLADIAKKYPMLSKDEQIELANKQILANASAELLEYSKFLNGGKLPNDARLLGKNAGRMILKSLNAGASKQEIIDMLLKAGISGRNSTAAKALIQTRDINAYNAQMRGGEAELIAELSQNVRVTAKNESIGAILGSAKAKALENDELLKKGVGNQGLDDVINTFKSSKSGKEFEVAENGFGRELLSYDGVAANEEMKRSFLAWEAQEKKADITLHDGRKVVFLEPDEAVQLSYGNSYLYGEKDLEALFARRRAESLEQKLKRLQSHPAYENLLKMRENTKASELKGDTVGGSKPTVFYEPQSERYLRTQGGGGLPNAERSITITKADVAKLRADKANEALATKLENNLEALTGDPAASGLIDDLLTRDYHLASAAKKSELVAPKNADEVVGNSRTPSDETVKSADEVAKSTAKITKAELQQQIDELEKLYHSKYYGEWARATAGEQEAKLSLAQKAINKANNEEQKLLAKKQTPSVKAKLNDVREIKAELEKQVNTLKKEISNTKKTQDEIENELENINKKRMELIKQRDSLESANAGMKAGFSTAEMPSTMLGGAAGHIAGSTAASSEYESEGGVAGAIIGALAGLTSPKAAAKIAAKMIAKKASKIELMPNMPFKEAQDKVQKDLMKYVGVDIKNADSGIVAQINNNGAKKIVSNDAIQKSRNNKFSAGEHLSVAQKTPELFKNATFIGRYDDIKNGESSVKILRFAKNIEVKGKNAVAIITAKESVDKDLKRIYSMELEELRKAELKFGNYDKTQTPASKPLISQDNGVVNSVAPIKDGANSTPKELLSQGQMPAGWMKGATNIASAQQPKWANKFKTKMAKMGQEYNDEKIANLANWHKDSHAITKESDGSPKVFYHGTNAKFDAFDIDKGKGSWLGKSFYFTDSKSKAKGYGKNVISTYLNLKNPYISKANDHYSFVNEVKEQFGVKENYGEFDPAQVLKQQGYDGVVYKDWDDEVGTIYTAFSPNQIKSIDNKGTFNPRSKMMRGFSTQALNELMLGLGGGGANAMAEDDPNKKAEAFIKGFLAGFGGAKAVSMLVKNAPKLAPQLARASEKMASDFPRLLNDRPDILGGVLGRMNNAKDKFSFIFGGEKAIGANKAKLEKARDMAKNGAKDDEIWAKTGWYKDIDGKWKFEINALGGEVKAVDHPFVTKDDFSEWKAQYIDKKLSLDELSELSGGKMGGKIDIAPIARAYNESENINIKELSGKYPNLKMSVADYADLGVYDDYTIKTRIKTVRDMMDGKIYAGVYRLDDILDDEALFKAYPQLKDMEVEITSIFDTGIKGGFNKNSNKIILDDNLSKDELKSTLYHELQHAVQKVEGFATGGNSKELGFLEYNRLAGEVEARNEQTRLIPSKLNAAKLERTTDFSDLEKIIKVLPKSQTNEQIGKELIKLKKQDMLLDEEYGKISAQRDKEIEKLTDELDDRFNALVEQIDKYELAKALLKVYNNTKHPHATADTIPEFRKVVFHSDGWGASYTPKQKEMRGIHNVTFNDKKATYIKTDLENIDSAIRYANSSRDKGAKHIKIRHLTDKTKSGYITNEELVNLGNSLREYIKINKEPFIDSNGARIYEWENKEGVRFRVVADSSRRDATTAELPQPRATDDIITFYSDRNLNEPMNFKNPNLNSAISNIKGQELSMRESFSPELKASYDMRDKLLKSTNEVRASLNEKGKAELEKLAGSKDSKLSRDAQIMKTLENAKSNPARYAKLKKLYLDENGKVKDSIGLC